jgi:hypothetical protein
MRNDLTEHRLGDIGTLIRAVDTILRVCRLSFRAPLVEQIGGDITLEIAVSAGNFRDLIVIRIGTIDDLVTRDFEVRG